MSRKYKMAMRALDRDLAAEKAATLIRKGVPLAFICAEMGMSEGALRRLAWDYDFRFPKVQHSKHWPQPEEEGDLGRVQSAYRNWERAVTGAAETRRLSASFSTEFPPLSTLPTGRGLISLIPEAAEHN